MLEQLIEAKWAERGEEYTPLFDQYRVPYPSHHALLRLPPDHPNLPKLKKFDGQGSPQAYYITVMGDLAADESYFFKFFASSLGGTAFEWYAKLKPGSISIAD